MKVWVVEAGWYDEESNIKGIYFSLEKAQEKESKLLNINGRQYDFIDITEWEVE